MLAITATIRKLLHDQRGATVIEYGLIAGLLVIAIVGAMNGFANEANGMWDMVAAELAGAR